MNIDVEDLWSSLPADLLQLTTNTIESPLDFFRVRSVCTSWRSSIPLPSFEQHTSRVNLSSDIVLINSTICRMSFLHPHSLSNSKGWLTKVTSSETGRLKLLQPLCNYQVKYEPITLSSADIRLVNIAKSSVLVDSNGESLREFTKVVCFNGNYDNKNNEFFVLAITNDWYGKGKVLCYWKHDDEKWTVLDCHNLDYYDYHDIIEYKGKLYVVNGLGSIFWIDLSSLNLVLCVSGSPFPYPGDKKYLVESCGDLYLVDRSNICGSIPSIELINDHTSFTRNRKEKKFRVYRLELDEELGISVQVQSLGDRAFVLTNDICFSISGEDFVGGKGDCVYFTNYDNFLGQKLSEVQVYQLESRNVEKLRAVPEYSGIFWPPKPS